VDGLALLADPQLSWPLSDRERAPRCLEQAAKNEIFYADFLEQTACRPGRRENLLARAFFGPSLTNVS